MKMEFKGLFKFGILSALLPALFLIIVVSIRDYLLIDYIHVLSAALWLGCNLFMGFIFYRIIYDLEDREKIDITVRLLPLTMFFLPAITIVTVIAGYVLAFYVNLFSYSYLIYAPIIVLSSILLLLSLVYYLYDSIKIYQIISSMGYKKDIMRFSF
ncbi:MAG: hypothetical protein QXL94_05870, partial [Candidatus Parvarchaeum sp.]